MVRTRVLAVAALLWAGLPVAAAAQSVVASVQPEESAGVVTTVNGDARLLRAMAAARPVALRMRDEIFVRDQISTEPRSLVRVLLGGKALVTVRELSVLTITEDAGRVTVDLQSGKIGVAVVKSRMRPGEVIEIRSPNATAAVRGTVFVVEVDPAKAEQSTGTPTTTTRVHLFHGALDVSARLDPAQSTVRLAELQSVVVSGNTLGAVQKISRDQVAALTSDLKPQPAQMPDAPTEFTSGLVAREQSRAVVLASSLLAPVAGPSLPGKLKTIQATTNGVTGVVTDLTGNTAETLERLMDSLGLVDTVGDTLGTVGGTVANLGDSLGGVVGGVGTTLNGVAGVAGGTVSGLGGAVGGVGGAVGGLGGAVGGVGGAVGGLGGTVGGVGGTV
ncbi:MAG TPA: FecR domain-containing protein, partial [Methylomirabilota bacterium]|nr:FecR domain-containing protein [Methylomirabilota bacterium]